MGRRPAVHGRRRRLHLPVRLQQGVRRDRRPAPTPTSRRSRRSTRAPSRSPSRSRPAAGSCRSSAATAQILPKHAMKDFVGAKSREAPLNTKPFGTGPYMVEDFKPGDLVIYKPNPNYRDAAKPCFEPDRDEGRRRRDLGRARGLPDRRVRLRLEPPGRGAGPPGHHERRQGRPAQPRRARASSRSTSTFTDHDQGGRRRARRARAPSTRSCPTSRSARRWRWRSTARRWSSSCTATATGEATAEHPDHAEQPGLEEHQVRVQHREGEQAPRRRRLQEGRRRHPDDAGRRRG